MARRDPLQPALLFADTHDTADPGRLVTTDGTDYRTEQTSLLDLTD